MEKQGKIVIFNNGEVELNLGNYFKPQVKRSIFGKEKLKIQSNFYFEREFYGPFDPKKTISIDAVDYKFDGVIVTSINDEGKIVLTHYYYSKNGKKRQKKSFEADNIIKCENPCLYLLEQNGKTRIYVPINAFLLPTRFEKVDTNNKELEDKCSVRVEEIIRSEANPEVYDRITYGYNPFSKCITTNIYSELQDRTIVMKEADELIAKRDDRSVGYVSDEEIVREEIKKYVDLLAFYLQREELTHKEAMKKIGTKR